MNGCNLLMAAEGGNRDNQALGRSRWRSDDDIRKQQCRSTRPSATQATGRGGPRAGGAAEQDILSLTTHITEADRARIQTRLRRMLHSPGITLEPPATRGGSVQIRVGDDVLGTVDQVVEEGERSWAVTLIILEEDQE